MAPQYTEISLDSLPDVLDYRCVGGPAGEDARVLRGIGRINLLVGRNNTGKSRLVRALYRAPHYLYASIEHPPGRYREIVEPVRKALVEAFAHSAVASYDGISPGFLDASTPERLSDASKIAAQVSDLERLLTLLTRELPPHGASNISFKPGQYDRSDGKPAQIQRTVLPLAHQALAKLKEAPVGSTTEARVYIPVLRGLRPLAGPNDVYSQRTENDYQLPVSGDRVIFTGLGLYSALDSLIRGTPEQRQTAKDYSQFLSAQFFDSANIDLTPRLGFDVVHIRIGDDSEFPVYGLGDGIQSMIALTFHAYTMTSPAVFLIEEPELHLHPGMQRRLLDLLAREPRLARHQYFITTHSNHLIDMAIDDQNWSTFVLSRHGRTTEIAPLAGRTKQALNELGARASSVFLTNASIWVEGVTDRLYLRAFLSKYLADSKETCPPREDTHYSLIEYGGANITHFDFGEDEDFTEGIRVASVCSRSFVVADGDIEKHTKRVATLREALKERLFVLRCKEIENLLPEGVIKRVAVGRGADPVRAERITEVDYQQPNTGLGAYLDGVFGGGMFSAPSGTVKHKAGFCADVIRDMQTHPWELTEQARSLCAALVAFVRTANE